MTKYLVNGDEVLLAIQNWNNVMNPNPRMLLKFSKFVGEYKAVPYNGLNSTWAYQVDETTYNKIKMLASPHHYALLKAFKAKTGWQGQIPPPRKRPV